MGAREMSLVVFVFLFSGSYSSNLFLSLPGAPTSYCSIVSWFLIRSTPLPLLYSLFAGAYRSSSLCSSSLGPQRLIAQFIFTLSLLFHISLFPLFHRSTPRLIV